VLVANAQPLDPKGSMVKHLLLPVFWHPLCNKYCMSTVSIKERSWVARVAAWKLGVDSVALTLGDTIHLHNAAAEVLVCDRRWLIHELKHVEQFRRYGFFRFTILYLWESLLNGYWDNRFEIEAREAEGSIH